MVENVAMAEADSSITYYSIVSRYIFHLAFLVADLNDLDIIVCDVINIYLNAPCQEKILFAAVSKHGPDKTGKVVFMVRASYG